jgi:hypothetical protein
LNQQSADPIVFVGPVELLQTTIPVEKNLPYFVKEYEKLVWAGTKNITIGTAVSAGSDVAL